MEQADIGKHHLFAQGGYIMFRNPIKFLPGFGGIADEQVYFCRSVIIFVDAHQDTACCEMARLPGNMDIKIFINEPNGSGFIGTVAIENNLYAYFTKGHADKITNGGGHTGGDDSVLGRMMLQDFPHHFHIVFRMTPVSLCIEVAHIEDILHPQCNLGHSARDFAGDKCFTTHRAFVIKYAYNLATP